jgi:hypothetical protein
MEQSTSVLVVGGRRSVHFLSINATNLFNTVLKHEVWLPSPFSPLRVPSGLLRRDLRIFVAAPDVKDTNSAVDAASPSRKEFLQASSILGFTAAGESLAPEPLPEDAPR